MAPAHQRLDRPQRAIHRLNGLIIKLKLFHEDRGAQFAFDEALIALLGQKFALEGDDGAAPIVLALVERQVRLGDQRIGIARILGSDRDAQRCRKPHVAPGQRTRAIELLEQTVAQALERGLGADPRQYESEFVATQPSDHRSGHQFLDGPHQTHQRLVSRRVTIAVIDRFEMVHVDLDIGNRHPIGLAHQFAQSVEEIFPREDPGEGVAVERGKQIPPPRLGNNQRAAQRKIAHEHDEDQPHAREPGGQKRYGGKLLPHGEAHQPGPRRPDNRQRGQARGHCGPAIGGENVRQREFSAHKG